MIKVFLFITFLVSFDEYEKISEYNIYKGDPHNLETTDQFTSYDLITPLFSDYSWKHRSIYIPNGKEIIYNNTEVFDFPIGTIISKT